MKVRPKGGGNTGKLGLAVDDLNAGCAAAVECAGGCEGRGGCERARRVRPRKTPACSRAMWWSR
jgi:hypothetical protein